MEDDVRHLKMLRIHECASFSELYKEGGEDPTLAPTPLSMLFQALSERIKPRITVNAEKNIMHEIISRAHCFFLFSHVQQTVGFFLSVSRAALHTALSSLLWPLISSCEIPQQ